jgi:hypothetical protein
MHKIFYCEKFLENGNSEDRKERGGELSSAGGGGGTSVNLHQGTGHRIPEDSTLHNYAVRTSNPTALRWILWEWL